MRRSFINFLFIKYYYGDHTKVDALHENEFYTAKQELNVRTELSSLRQGRVAGLGIKPSGFLKWGVLWFVLVAS
jgi:hypothetical protein